MEALEGTEDFACIMHGTGYISEQMGPTTTNEGLCGQVWLTVCYIVCILGSSKGCKVHHINYDTED